MSKNNGKNQNIGRNFISNVMLRDDFNARKKISHISKRISYALAPNDIRISSSKSCHKPFKNYKS